MTLTPQDLKTSDVVNPQTGQKWVYSDIVRDHFFNPRNLMLKDPKDNEYDALGVVGSPTCGDVMTMWLKIDKATEIIYELKWRTFGSMAAGSRIVMANPETQPIEKLAEGNTVLDGAGKPNTIEAVFKKKYRGTLIDISLSTSSYYSFSCTPNHPILAVRRDEVAAIHRKSGMHWSEVDVKKVAQVNPQFLPASELKRSDFLVFEIPSRIVEDKRFTRDLCTLLGYYVSDGFLRSKRQATFKFNRTEHKYAAEVMKIAKQNGWSAHINQSPKEYIQIVVIDSPWLVAFLREHGGSPNQKVFSTTAMELRPYFQQHIIGAYVKGDGWILNQNPNWKPQHFISTAREHIAHQLQIMLGRCEIFAPIHRRGPKIFTIRGKTYTNSGEYNLIYRKGTAYSRIKYIPNAHSFLIPIQKVTIRQYNGLVYDIGLAAPPHTFRVNGITVHNCGSAIAATSMFSVIVTENGGMKIEDALKISPKEITERLGGLPDRKIHCSVLADKAFRKAVNNYFRATGQHQRILVEGAKVVDPALNITDRDIEEAVLEGATTLEEVQKKLKVGVGSPEAIPEIEQLIRFYREKYYACQNLTSAGEI